MSNLASKIGNIIHNHHIFRLIAIFFYIFQNVPSNFNLEVIPIKIILFWGIYLVIKDFFFEKIMFQPKYSWLVVLILVSYAFSVVLNISYQFPQGPVNWSYLALSLLLVYPYDRNENLDDTKKWMIRFNDCVIYVLFFTALVSLILFAINAQYWVINGTGETWMRQGFLENRLFGVYTSPNFGSMLGLLSVFLSFVNNILKRGSWNHFQTLYLVNIFVQYLYFTLSSSRGTRLSIIASMLFIVFLLLVHRLQKDRRYFRHIFKAALTVLASLFLFSACNNASQQILSYLPSTVEFTQDVLQGEANLSFSEGMNAGSADNRPSPIVIQHSDENSELSSGRFTIWRAGLKALKQRPLFGLADADLYRDLGEFEAPVQIDSSKLDQISRSELKRASGNMHNAYVSILVYTGLVGTSLFVIWAGLYAYHHLAFLFSKKFDWNRTDHQLFATILIMLIAILVDNLVETHIVFSNGNSIGFIFWTYAGYLSYLKAKMPVA